LAGDAEVRLRRPFYERDTLLVANELLGATLVHENSDGATRGRIVEVEAYRGKTDLASHAARSRQGAVESMWGPCGIAYVYRAYGIHVMFNVTAKESGETGAVLIRAVEPLTGQELMRGRRKIVDDRMLTTGPGNCCQAFGIMLSDHGTDLTSSDRIWIERGRPPRRIKAGERIGISRSTEHPWRYFDAESRHVSAHRRGSDVT